MSDTQEVLLPLSAQNLTEALKSYGEQAISAIEKNSNCRILSITLLFIQDTERKIWLMGSTHCNICEKTLFRSATPGRTLEKITLDTSATLASLKVKKASFANKDRCAGDFCEYMMDKEGSSQAPDEQYEEFITKISLNYTAGDSHKYRQELASNCVEKEFERARVSKLANKISFRYILIGKKLIEAKGKYRDLTIFPEEIQNIEEPEYRSASKPPNALAHPSRLYDEAKVCERCYIVYNLMRIFRVKSREPANLPRISRDISNYFNMDQHNIPETDERRLSKFDKAKYTMLYTMTTSQKPGPETKLIEDISSKFLPSDYLASWSLKTQQQKNNEIWQKYISSLKRKSVLRNRLKSNNT